MGRSRYRITQADAPHFFASTVVHWIPIFTQPQIAQIVLDSFAFLQRKRALKLYGYVILEDHLHWIAEAADLTKTITAFKSYTVRLIVDHLDANGSRRFLEQLAFAKKRHKTDRAYQVWQEGSHPQLIQGDEMMRQKLDYIHLNPVKRGYVDDPVHWRYSSARNYQGQEGLVDVYTDWL